MHRGTFAICCKILCHANRFEEALIVGPTLPRDVIRGAVIGRCAHKRQPSSNVDTASASDHLQRDEALVVILRNDAAEALPMPAREKAIGGERSFRPDTPLLEVFNRWSDDGVQETENLPH